jgi:hypothetical protein
VETIAAAGAITIKQGDGQFTLFVNGAEIETNTDYDAIAKLATDIHMSKVRASGDKLIGTRMYAPSAVDNGGPVIVIAKTEHGYLVQRTGSTQRFEITENFLSTIPAFFS